MTTNLNKRIVFFSLFALIPQVLAANPNIASISGSPMHGQNITITGSGFGVKDPVEPMKYDDFESGTLGNALAGWALSVASQPSIKPVYSNSYIRPNSLVSAKCQFPSTPNQWLDSFGVQSQSPLANVYIDSWYLYDPTDPSSANHKVFRFYSGQTDGYPNLYFNVNCQPTGRIGSDGVPCFPDCNMQHWNNWDVGAADKTWVHIQGYFKMSSTTQDDGVAMLWINGDLITNEQAFRTRTEAYPLMWHSIWFGNYLGHTFGGVCGVAEGQSNTFWDNTYVDSTQARVEIGNASTYDASTHREIQIPHTTWNDNEIEFTVNLGSFNTSEQLYLFVVNADGNVSEGYPLAREGVPTITSVSGTISHNANITISGSGFGVKNPVAPMKYDDFETGTVDTNLVGWALSYGGAPDPKPMYSATYLRPNSVRSAKTAFPADPNQYLNSFGVQSDSDILEIYLDAWYLYDPADPPSSNHKLFRLYSGQEDGVPNFYLNVYCDSTGTTAYGSDGLVTQCSYGWIQWQWRLAMRHWVHFQGYFRHGIA